MLLREQLISDFVGLLLDSVRNNGWLTHVSDDAGINRKKMNRKGLASMPLGTILRLILALCHHLNRRSPKDFMALWWKLGLVIQIMEDEHYWDLIDERRK